MCLQQVVGAALIYKLCLNILSRYNVSKITFPLSINTDVLAAMQRWADKDVRSVNAQIEYVLRDTLVKYGRVKLVHKVITEVVDTDIPKNS
jgi:hypothetical protein